MPSNRMLKHRIKVERMADATDSSMVRAVSLFADNVPALVMPADEDASTQFGITISQAYKVYTNTNITLKNTDKITDSRGRIFKVRGTRELEGFGRVSHNIAYIEMIGRTSDASEAVPEEES